MRCYVVVAGAVTVLVLSSYKSSTHPDLVKRLKANDIEKLMLMELPVDLVRERYGEHFSSMARSLGPEDFRVLDFNGASIFRRFKFAEMGEALKVEF